MRSTGRSRSRSWAFTLCALLLSGPPDRRPSVRVPPSCDLAGGRLAFIRPYERNRSPFHPHAAAARGRSASGCGHLDPSYRWALRPLRRAVPPLVRGRPCRPSDVRSYRATSAVSTTQSRPSFVARSRPLLICARSVSAVIPSRAAASLRVRRATRLASCGLVFIGATATLAGTFRERQTRDAIGPVERAGVDRGDQMFGFEGRYRDARLTTGRPVGVAECPRPSRLSGAWRSTTRGASRPRPFARRT
jgi:hypothetical protein